MVILKKLLMGQKKKKMILKSLHGSGSKEFLINKNLRKSINILKGRNCYETNINYHKKTFNKKSKYVYAIL